MVGSCRKYYEPIDNAIFLFFYHFYPPSPDFKVSVNTIDLIFNMTLSVVKTKLQAHSKGSILQEKESIL